MNAARAGEPRCSCCLAGSHDCGSECLVCDGTGARTAQMQDSDGALCTLPHNPDCDCAHRTDGALPAQRLFGPTYGLDHRLFDGERLKPEVRAHILRTLGSFWSTRYGSSWPEWSRVYFAGSEASEWTDPEREGNNDFDVLVGIDYDSFRAHLPQFAAHTDQEITDQVNAEFKAQLDPVTDPCFITVDGVETGPWSNTWYCNPHSYDIRDIRPYAAYDVGADEWAVKPPHLPDWDITRFPEGTSTVDAIRAITAYAQAVLDMPEPYRTQMGAELWDFIHSNRSNAFGPEGEGWWDLRNVLEKALDQEGLWQRLWEIKHRSVTDPMSLATPAGWSNDPRSLSALPG